MQGPIARTRTWYAKPENELVRREVAWSFDWLFHQRGWLWVMAYAAISLGGLHAMTLAREMGAGPPISRGMSRWLWAQLQALYTNLFYVAGYVMFYVCWLRVLRTRTFAPLAGARLQHLLLSPTPPSSLWPGLLVAPILVGAFLYCGAAPLMLVYMAYPVILMWQADPAAVPGMPLYLFGWPLWLFIPLSRQLSFPLVAAVVALPKGSVVKIVVSAVVLYMGYVALETLTRRFAYSVVDAFGLRWWGRDSPPMSLAGAGVYHATVALPDLALTLTIFFGCLKWLKSDRAETKLRAVAKIDG